MGIFIPTQLGNFIPTHLGIFTPTKLGKSKPTLTPGGYYLNKEGKALLIGAVNEMFDREIKYRGRNIKIGNTIQMECHRIANSLIKKGDAS